jgi:hypothetical protein
MASGGVSNNRLTLHLCSEEKAAASMVEALLANLRLWQQAW